MSGFRQNLSWDIYRVEIGSCFVLVCKDPVPRVPPEIISDAMVGKGTGAFPLHSGVGQIHTGPQGA